MIVKEIESLLFLLRKDLASKSLESQNTYQYLNLSYVFIPNVSLNITNTYQNQEIEIFKNILQNSITFPNKVSLLEESNRIRVEIQLDEGVLDITVIGKMLLSPTTYIFVLWILFLTLLLLTIALTFSKNQIKSILELSKVADIFGQGINKKILYKPTGATEIRKAGFAFLRMKERIEKQIQKRTQMLAMISHDLKTPLTSLRLQITMLSEQNIADEMLHDVERMEQMIASYLDFARGEGGEQFSKVKIGRWMKKYTGRHKFENLKIIYGKIDLKVIVNIKEQAFKRAIDNILSNAAKYANIVSILVYSNKENVILDIEDNGSGINNYDKGLVFSPFYRSDKSRDINDAGNVGLGLTVTKEIILGHNGSISLLDGNNLKGLLVRIYLPKSFD